MADDLIERRFKEVVNGVGASVKPIGFVKRRMAFRHLANGNAAIIEFQRSQSSSSSSIRFTVNVGVICGRLLDEYWPDVSKAGSSYAHLRERLGAFLPIPFDKWWTVEASTDPVPIVREIAGLLTGSAAPFLLDHIADEALKSLWMSGKSPGLTEGQRIRYLADLEGANVSSGR
jgi:hypothetical protein